MKTFLKYKINFIIILLFGMIITFSSVFADETNNSTNIINYKDINCNKALIMDAKNGSVIYSKNGFDKVFPASTTKVLTAILAIENLDLQKSVVASSTAIYATPEESSSMYIQIGEVLTVKQLLYGLMLPSGNDAANVLAESVSGDISKFVELMNAKSKEIGCTNTHFVNPHGFHDDNHYTTAYDMAKILRYAIQNKTFREIIETKYIEIPATNKTNTVRKLTNTNKLVNKNYKSTYYYEYAIAGKTGFTNEARGTLVTYGKKDGKEVIVTLFDGTQLLGKEVRYYDAKKLFEYAFNNYSYNTLLNANSFKFDFFDKNTNKTYTLKLNGDITSLTSKNKNYIITYNDMLVDVEKLNTINNNIKIYQDNLENQIIGSVNIRIKGENLLLENKYNLIIDSVKDNSTLLEKISNSRNFKLTLLILLFLIIILLVIVLVKNKKSDKNNYLDNKRYSRIKLKHRGEKF